MLQLPPNERIYNRKSERLAVIESRKDVSHSEIQTTESPANIPAHHPFIPKVLEPAFEVFEDGNWICFNCSGQFMESDSIGRHFFSCLKLQFTFPLSKSTTNLKNETDDKASSGNLDTKQLGFRCNLCSKEFTEKRRFEVHMKVHSTAKPFACNNCGSRFKYLHNKVRHERNSSCGRVRGQIKLIQSKHKKFSAKWNSGNPGVQDSQQAGTTPSPNNGNEFKCKQCSKAFKLKRYLQAHEVVHTTLRPYHCSKCNASFKHKRAKDRHQRLNKCSTAVPVSISVDSKPIRKSTHVRPKTPWFCGQCSRSFLRKRVFHEHMKSHATTSSSISYDCFKCPARFRGRISLTSHIKALHPEVDPFLCTICNSRFRETGRLEKHMRSSHPEAILKLVIQESSKTNRKFYCNQCSRSFPRKTAFEKHMMAHSTSSSTTSYDCDACQARFKYRISLTMHINAFHAEVYPYPCTLCKSGFRQKSLLDDHMKTHIRGSRRRKKLFLRCDQCSRSFTRTSELKRHMTSHSTTSDASYQCSTCGARFKYRVSLTNHIQKVHPGVNPFRCTICNVRFKSTWNIRRHMLTRHKIQSSAKPESIFLDESSLRKRSAAECGTRSHACSISNARLDSKQDVKEHKLNHRRPSTLAAPEKLRQGRSQLKQVIVPLEEKLLDDVKAILRAGPETTESDSLQQVSSKPEVSTSTLTNTTQEALASLRRVSLRSQSSTPAVLSRTISTLAESPASASVTTLSSSSPQTATRRSVFLRKAAKPELLTSATNTAKSGSKLSSKQSSKTFKSKKYLPQLKFVQSTSTSRPFQCTTCGLCFKRKCNLQNHVISHSDIKPFPCDHCGMTFSRQDSLAKHLSRHAVAEGACGIASQPWKCVYHYCQASFSEKNDLFDHTRSHNRRLTAMLTSIKFRCPSCRKQFPSHQKLKVHIKIHRLGDAPFKCPNCPQKFRFQSSLRLHQANHTEMRPYPCTVCGRKFKQQGALKNHRDRFNHIDNE